MRRNPTKRKNREGKEEKLIRWNKTIAVDYKDDQRTVDHQEETYTYGHAQDSRRQSGCRDHESGWVQ